MWDGWTCATFQHVLKELDHAPFCHTLQFTEQPRASDNAVALFWLCRPMNTAASQFLHESGREMWPVLPDSLITLDYLASRVYLIPVIRLVRL